MHLWSTPSSEGQVWKPPGAYQLLSVGRFVFDEAPGALEIKHQRAGGGLEGRTCRTPPCLAESWESSQQAQLKPTAGSEGPRCQEQGWWWVSREAQDLRWAGDLLPSPQGLASFGLGSHAAHLEAPCWATLPDLGQHDRSRPFSSCRTRRDVAACTCLSMSSRDVARAYGTHAWHRTPSRSPLVPSGQHFRSGRCTVPWAVWPHRHGEVGGVGQLWASANLPSPEALPLLLVAPAC